MMSRLKHKKGLLLVLLSFVLVAVISAGGTIAYFSGGDEVRNTLTLGNVEIALDEPGWDPETGLHLTPGSRADKDPTITALEGDSYVRVKMEIVDGEGSPITDEDRLALILRTLWYDRDGVLTGDDAKYLGSELQAMEADGHIDGEYNREQFSFAGIEEGNPSVRYYHYNGIFSSDEGGSAVLFTDMIIPRDWHNDELFALGGDIWTVSESGVVEVTQKGTGYQIILTGEAIQAAEMESAEEAFAALDDATGVMRDVSIIAGQEG